MKVYKIENKWNQKIAYVTKSIWLDDRGKWIVCLQGTDAETKHEIESDADGAKHGLFDSRAEAVAWFQKGQREGR